MSHVAHIVTEHGISLYLNGKSHSINRDHPSFEQVKVALRNKKYDDIEALLDVSATVSNWLASAGDSQFALEGGLVLLDGRPFSEAVSAKVLRMIEDGADPQPLYNFLRKVRQNPSASAQRELLLFCEANNFLIHEDGDLLAYKAVREDYRDVHSGTNDNSVGQVVSMERSDVDDRRDVTCSFGLHFAAYDYAANVFGPAAKHVMVLKINPADVVSIPEDYNNQKGRCCRYEVIGEREDFQPLPETEVYTDDILFGDCSGSSTATATKRVTNVNVWDRVTSVLRNVLGLEQATFSNSDTLYDLDLSKSQIEELQSKLEREFEAFGVSFLHSLHSNDSVDAIVSLVQNDVDAYFDEQQREEEEDEEEDGFSFDDDDYEEDDEY